MHLIFDQCLKYVIYYLDFHRTEKSFLKSHQHQLLVKEKKKEKKKSKTMIHSEFVIHPEPLGFNYRLFQGQVTMKADVRTDHQRGDRSVLLPTGESSSTL